MSPFMIPPQSKMDTTVDIPCNWEFFKSCWKSCVIAIKVHLKEKGTCQSAMLLSVMGKECLHVCRNLCILKHERQDDDVILTKLNEYFKAKRNAIYEGYAFNSLSQKPAESFDPFLTTLCKLAPTCLFGSFEVENLMLSNPIVTGMRPWTLQTTSMRHHTKNAINICCTNKMAANQRHEMEQSDSFH